MEDVNRPQLRKKNGGYPGGQTKTRRVSCQVFRGIEKLGPKKINQEGNGVKSVRRIFDALLALEELKGAPKDFK